VSACVYICTHASVLSVTQDQRHGTFKILSVHLNFLFEIFSRFVSDNLFLNCKFYKKKNAYQSANSSEPRNSWKKTNFFHFSKSIFNICYFVNFCIIQFWFFNCCQEECSSFNLSFASSQYDDFLMNYWKMLKNYAKVWWPVFFAGEYISCRAFIRKRLRFFFMRMITRVIKVMSKIGAIIRELRIVGTYYEDFFWYFADISLNISDN